MKRIIFTTITILAFLTSCSLKEELISKSNINDYYKTLPQCQSGINACYNLLRTQFNGANFWQATECTTDLMFLNISTQYNATLDISPTKPAVASTIWQYSYMGVMRCNSILAALERGIENGYFNESDALSYQGEAIVLRSFFYYLLTCTFGDVPYYTEEVTQDNREAIAGLPRMSADDTRDKLISQIKEWIYPQSMGGKEALPLKRPYDGVIDNRLGAAAGLMLAGKFCMWNERWEDAIEVFGLLENIYGHYADNPEAFAADYPISDIPFSKKNVPESIFEISNVYQEYGQQTTGRLAYFCTPLQGKAVYVAEDGGENEYMRIDVFNGIAIPELGAYSRIAVSARPTTYYFMTVLPYQGKDLRSGEYSDEADIARGGSGNLAWRWNGFAADDTVRNEEDRSVRWFSSCTKANTRPWLGNKFWCNDMYYDLDSNNYKFFRFADVELMLAEAHLRAGNTEAAAKYLNITRTRAGIDKITLASVGGNEEALMEEIRLERARELFGEFQRKFDLVRWGIWYERTLAYNDGLYVPGFIRPYHRYLPIPANQITYSHGALDNKEYEQ